MDLHRSLSKMSYVLDCGCWLSVLPPQLGLPLCVPGRCAQTDPSISSMCFRSTVSNPQQIISTTKAPLIHGGEGQACLPVVMQRIQRFASTGSRRNGTADFYCIYTHRPNETGFIPDCEGVNATLLRHAEELTTAGIAYVVFDGCAEHDTSALARCQLVPPPCSLCISEQT